MTEVIIENVFWLFKAGRFSDFFFYATTDEKNKVDLKGKISRLKLIQRKAISSNVWSRRSFSTIWISFRALPIVIQHFVHIDRHIEVNNKNFSFIHVRERKVRKRARRRGFLCSLNFYASAFRCEKIFFVYAFDDLFTGL